VFGLILGAFARLHCQVFFTPGLLSGTGNVGTVRRVRRVPQQIKFLWARCALGEGKANHFAQLCNCPSKCGAFLVRNAAIVGLLLKTILPLERV
jgi:hypothetical protein